MSRNLIIIKIGGSVITDKTKDIPTPNIKIIKDIGQQLSQLYKLGSYQLLLIHGAGSYGHPLVKQFNLNEGIKTEKQFSAVSQVQSLMIQLNNLMLNYFDFPCTVFPPHSFIYQDNKELSSFNTELIEKALSQNIVPVLFGDMIYDISLGYSVVSGDTLTSYLAQKIYPKKVIFLSDVNGIYDRNPKIYSEAKLITEINSSNLKSVLTKLSTNKSNDTTGEMRGKLLSIQKYLPGIEVLIINGGYQLDIRAAVSDSYLFGTKILF